MGLSRILAAAVFLLPFSAAGQQGRPELRPEQWRADLRFLADSLIPRHPNFFRRAGRPRVEREIAELESRIGQASRVEVIAGFQRIISLAQDGHSRLLPGFDAQIGFHALPIALYWFEEGIHVRAAAPELSEIVGGKVLRIGNVDIEEAVRRVEPLAAHESPSARRAESAWLLEVPEVLQAVGITATSGAVPIVVSLDGGEVSVTLRAGSGPPVTGVRAPADWLDARPERVPLGSQRLNETRFLELLPREQALYVRLSAIANQPNETFERFVQKIFATADSNRVARIVLDLRWNNGGDNTLLEPLITGIVARPQFNRRTGFFVLMGRHTFSAAQNLVTRLENRTNVSLVGESSGAPPNHYGDAARYRLPNSGITVLLSTVSWQDAEPQDRRSAVTPHVSVPTTFADYRAGKDAALEAALRAR